MILLAFAHRGEAQSFISHFNLKTSDNRLFVNEDISLLLTGEGICEVLTYINFTIAQINPSIIYNYGIAGSLSNKALKDSIYKIRTHYYYSDSIEFKSYTCAEGELDSISTNQRVLSDDYAKELSHFAHIVEREAWAIAKSAQSHKIPFETYKLISDIAGGETACFDIKNMALAFSQKMLAHFLENIKSVQEIKPFYDFEETALSFTQKALLKKLINLKSRKEDSLVNELCLYYANILKGLNKNEAARCLEDLYKELLPFQAKAQEHFELLTRQLQEIGVNCTTDPHFEKKSLNLSFKINSQANIDNLKKTLESLSFESFDNIWNGKFDV